MPVMDGRTDGQKNIDTSLGLLTNHTDFQSSNQTVVTLSDSNYQTILNTVFRVYTEQY